MFGGFLIAYTPSMFATGRHLYCLGLIGLGAIGVLFADVPVQWPPPPVFASLRVPLGIVSAILLASSGIGLASGRTQRVASLLGALGFLLWAVFLHAPRLPGARHAVAECVALAVGALACVPSSTAERFDLVVRYPFGICLIAFGAAHFVYADFTMAFMPLGIPPGRAFWVYATGAGLIAAGVSFLVNVATRLAAILVGVTFSSFVLFVHVPRIAADPGSRLDWTVVCVALALTGAAWTIAATMAPARTQVRPEGQIV